MDDSDKKISKDLARIIDEANAGDPGAQYDLALEYDPECFRGLVPPDELEAGKWYVKAAENGHYRAQCWLGYIYEYGGYGLEKSLEKAAMWYRSALTAPYYANGDYEARMGLIGILELMEENDGE